MKKRPLFSVVTARAAASEQRQLLEGIITEAFKVNTDIAVISNICNASEYNDFITHENSIYTLISSHIPDGIILTEDSFINRSLREYVTKLISERRIPAVSISSDSSIFPYICNDTSEDIAEITDHLIEEHGFSHIDILTGPAENSEAVIRTEGFIRSLRSHGLKCSNENIIYGDFWTASGEKTALEYISGKRKMPQAVVCANDYMAYSLCDTLVRHGIKIPQDITVTGYEYVGDRTDHFPLLTTYCRNRRAMGANAVRKLMNMIRPDLCYGDSDLSGYLVPGCSCTCGADYKMISEETEYLKKQKFFSSLNDTGMLEQYLTESGSISDLVGALRKHSYFIPDHSGLYMCLYEDWSVRSINRKTGHTDTEEMVCYTIEDSEGNTDVPFRFRYSELFPEKLIRRDGPSAYYCCPLFFMKEDFGYMTVRYDKAGCLGESFGNWNRIVSNALEFLRMKKDISYLVDCLNISEYHDSLTGMCSRTGFLNETSVSLKNSEDDRECSLIHIELNCSSYEKVSGSTAYEKNNRMITDISNILRTKFSAGGRLFGRTGPSSFCIADFRGGADKVLLTVEKLRVCLYGYFRRSGVYGDEHIFIDSYSGKTSDFDFAEILEDLESKSAVSVSAFSEKSENKEYIMFSKLRKSIFISPGSPPNADEACRQFLLSSGHFRVIYKELFGRSYHKDCIFLRVLLAKDLLLSTGMNISSVSEKCGFENDKYFMRQFRQETGYTPNQYREIFSDN